MAPLSIDARPGAAPGSTTAGVGSALLAQGSEPRRISRLGWRVLEVTAALIGWAAATWPWVTRMWSEVPGGDGAGFVWFFWWVRRSLATASTPLATAFQFAPEGASFALHTGLPAFAVVTTPLQWLVGPARAFNLTGVLLVVLACVCAAALARDLGLPPAPALVAGLAFALAPSVLDRAARQEHLNLASVFWLPLLILAIRRWEQADGTVRRGMRAALVGICAGLAVWTDVTVGVWAAIAALAYLCWSLVAGPLRREVNVRAALGSAALAAVVAATLLAPLAVAVSDAITTGRIDAPSGLGGSPGYANDLAGLLVGDEDAPLADVAGVGTWLADARAGLGSRGEGANDLGAAVVLLAVIGGFALFRAPAGDRLRRHLPWLLGLTVVAVVLSLGPVLVVAGRAFVPLATTLPGEDAVISQVMPYTWLQRLPLLSGLRAPGRFSLVAALPLALLAGRGALALGRHRAGWPVLALAVVLFALEAPSPVDERLPIAASTTDRSIAADTDRTTVVVDVPLGWRTGFGQVGRWSDAATLRAIHHGHPIATGFVARLDYDILTGLATRPLYRDLLALQDLPEGVTPPPTDPVAGAADARAARLDWVVIDLDRVSVTAANALATYLAAAGYERVEAGGAQALWHRTAGGP